MKHIRCMLLAVLGALFLFCSCTGEAAVKVDGDTPEFLEDGKTATYAGQVYTYSVTDSNITIQYPGGYTYIATLTDGQTIAGRWTMPLDAQGILSATELGYLDENVLVTEIQRRAKARVFPFRIIPSLLLATIGVLLFLNPNKAFYLSVGWQFKHAEPSDAALGWLRFVGIVFVIAGGVLLFL